MPDKEKVLQWYASLKETLKAEGVDVTKPGDLMRIRTMYYKESAEEPGRIESGDGEIRYAFMNKSIDPTTNQRTVYNVPMPEISKEDQLEVSDKEDEYSEKIQAEKNAFKAFEQAQKSGKSYQQLEQLKEEHRIAEEEAKTADKNLRGFYNDLWKEQDQWRLKEQSFFDPEKDYDQIADLYEQAEKGLLYFHEPSHEVDDRRQILVNKNGKAAVGPSLTKMNFNEVRHEQLHSAEGAMKEQLEQKYGPFPSLKSVPPRPKAIPEVPKPTAFSWFKRIISFGIVKTDFTRYDNYLQEKAVRDAEIAEYDRTLPEVKQQVRAHNEEAYKRYDEIVGAKHAAEYPEDIKNPGRMALMQNMIHVVDIMPPFKEDGTDNVWDRSHEMKRRHHIQEMRVEMHENPQSFREDGSRNIEESEKFWEKKIDVDPKAREKIKKENKAQEVKREKSQVSRELHERVLKDRFDNLQKGDLAEFLGKENQVTGNGNNSWVKQDLVSLFTNIGKLYGMNGQYGMNIFMAACVQNQKFDEAGEPRPAEEVLSNAECANNLETLVYYANHPPRTEEERKQLYEGTLEKFELMASGVTVSRVADSIASIVAENVEEMDQFSTRPHIAQAASLLPFILNQNKSFNFVDDGNQVNGKDLSVSGRFDRDFALKFGTQCAKLQDGYKKKMEAHKQGFVKKADDVVEEKKTKNLNIKRPLDLGK